MRVAFAHYSQANDISGVTTWVLGMAARLAADGDEVAVHFQCADHGAGAEPPLFEALRRQGIAVFSSPRQSTLRDDAAATLAFLDHWRPRVFLPQCRPAHFAAAAHAGRRGLPWAFTLHSDDPHYWRAVRAFGSARQGAALVCVSRHIQAELRRRGIDRPSHVIPCGVAIPAAVSGYRSDPFRVVYSGRLWEHQKRASLVIRALIAACRSSPALRATLIGDGHARAACERLVAEAGLTGAIDFSGLLTPAAVQARLAGAQAILLMSDFEGLPVALLEAMAAGVVPVARAIPSGIPELVRHEDTGLLVSEDPQEAARALLRLAADPVLWQRCSTAARDLVSREYSAESSHEQWRSLLTELEQRFPAAPAGPYPASGERIGGLRRLDRRLHQEYRPVRPPGTPWRQRLRTTIARTKHRLRTALRRRPPCS